MFYVVILFFFLGAGSREPGGGRRLWQPGAGTLIYFLEYHCAASGEVEL